jgi:alpha-D-xyloside xylohydrolase
VTRRFTTLKLELMPYLYRVGIEAHETGTPFMRPMQLEFAGDPAVDYLDRQYLLGHDLLVAPVFSAAGDVQYYLPAGRWTDYLTGETTEGPQWRTETHGFDSLPLWVREGAVIVTGSQNDRPDYDYTVDPLVTVYPGFTGSRDIEIDNPLNGTAVTVTVSADAGVITVSGPADVAFRAVLAGGDAVASSDGSAVLR